MNDFETETEETYNSIIDEMDDIQSYEPKPERNKMKIRPVSAWRLEKGILVMEAIRDLPLN